jgi:hypothetical protein
MLMTGSMRSCVAAFFSTLAFLSPCYGGVIHDESVNGDLSNIFSAPTPLSINLGSNQVFGTTGPLNGGFERDYFSITLTAGQHLVSIRVLEGTTGDSVGPPLAFIAVTSGPMINPVGATAADLLGYYLFGPPDIDQDILDNMASSNTNLPPPQGFGAAQGFTAPLGPGTYTFWVQEGTSDIDYRLELNVIPEPASIVLVGIGLGALLLRRRVRRSVS